MTSPPPRARGSLNRDLKWHGGGGGLPKNLKIEVTSFMNGPERENPERGKFKISNIFWIFPLSFLLNFLVQELKEWEFQKISVVQSYFYTFIGHRCLFTILKKKCQYLFFAFYSGSLQEFDAAFNFGTRYEKKCQIPAHLLFNYAQNPTFYDLYIPYKSDSAISNKLFAVPISILVLIIYFFDGKSPSRHKQSFFFQQVP